MLARYSPHAYGRKSCTSKSKSRVVEEARRDRARDGDRQRRGSRSTGSVDEALSRRLTARRHRRGPATALRDLWQSRRGGRETTTGNVVAVSLWVPVGAAGRSGTPDNRAGSHNSLRVRPQRDDPCAGPRQEHTVVDGVALPSASRPPEGSSQPESRYGLLPRRRPASTNQPLVPRWPALHACFFDLTLTQP